MPLRILHVGLGMRGRQWLDFVAAFPGATSVAAVEPDPATREALRAGPHGGLRCVATLGEALSSAEADAALIASPSALHAEQALEALGAGLHVMVEKPFATSVVDALRVTREAERLGRTAMVAENFRYVPAERTVRRAVADGLLGAISGVSLTDKRRMPSATQGPWVRAMQRPQLAEIAVHHFDSLRGFFARRPLAVGAHTWNPPWSDYPAGACTQTSITFEDGIHAQYSGSLVSARFAYRLSIEGERGDLWTDRKLVLWRPRGKRLFLPLRKVKGLPGDGAPYPREGTTSLLESLRAAVEEGREPETSGRENLWAIAMVEAATRADEERRTVAVDELYVPEA